MSKELTEKSKYLSYLLRHKPEAANLQLDKEGWVSLDDVLENTDLTIDEIRTIVDTDTKKRYSIQLGKIRANQGHSTEDVRLTFNKGVPPVVLFHGTNDGILSVILKEGLKPMDRHHVHLSSTREVAESVGGRRRGGLVVLQIDAKRMLADGHSFFISENGIWLVDAVPAKYLRQDSK